MTTTTMPNGLTSKTPISTSSFSSSATESTLDIPKEELKVLSFWDSINAFKMSLELAKDRPRYNFLDGPPFATGLPHYGHLLAGTIKDTVLRYACQQGYYVERRFGWDCHGLPVEYEIDKKLGITCRQDVEDRAGGIAGYNSECRAIVMRYAEQWEDTVKRMGRWIDFKEDYKTMYPWFMESVWWVFKELFTKEQVYRGFRVMPWSTACTTPLSNFEVKQNYKDTTDPSIIVTMLLVTNEHSSETKVADISLSLLANASLLIWTTTPWTLPSNLAVAVKPEMEYALVKVKDRHYILATSRVDSVFPKKKGTDQQFDVEVVTVLKGAQLIGLRYEPPFDFFKDRRDKFPLTHTVVASEHVTDDTGTGLVHMAPGHGEEDYDACVRAGGLISETDVPCPVDERGLYTTPVSHPDLLKKYVKDADSIICKMLGDRLLSRSQLTHSYPFCWRSDTPLLYRAVPCWFVRVQPLIPRIIKASSQSKWVPEFVQDKRFHNWIEQAHDWAVSRNRYWGTPIPIWTTSDYKTQICIGSIEELERMTGQPSGSIKDLHRESIDHLTITLEDGTKLTRVDEVLDCWFESGCVPYALHHYPFEMDQEEFLETRFPANFIGEGLDQTRGWFYTLLVLSTHLFDMPPFRNVVVNGLVLAADGKKMSKRLKNYPEPGLILDKYGADALRLYLINSPVVCAETLKFREDGVAGVVKDVLLPWFHAQRYLLTSIDQYTQHHGETLKFYADTSVDTATLNLTDRWILGTLQSLSQQVQHEMNNYRLYAVIPPLLQFIDHLTNWYIRFNRKRLLGKGDEKDVKESTRVALDVLFRVLYQVALLMAPYAPFMAEAQYQKLLPYKATSTASSEDCRSVHFMLLPKEVQTNLIDSNVERAFARLRTLVERVRMMRDQRAIPLKIPLKQVTVISSDTSVLTDLCSLQSYILSELNVRHLELSEDEHAWAIQYNAVPNWKALGARLRGDLASVQAALKQVSNDQLKDFIKNKQLHLAGHTLGPDDLTVTRSLALPDSCCEAEMAIVLDCTMDTSLLHEGLTRDLCNRVQRLRKEAKLVPTDAVVTVLHTKSDALLKILKNQIDYLSKHLVNYKIITEAVVESSQTAIIAQDESFEEELVEIHNKISAIENSSSRSTSKHDICISLYWAHPDSN